MDKFENCMNPPEYEHGENPVTDAFTKDGNTDKTADTEHVKNTGKSHVNGADKHTVKDMVNHPVKSTEKDTNNTTDKNKNSRAISNANLIDMNHRTEKEQRDIAIAGGKASGEARRKKKELKDRCKILLEMMPNKALITKSLGDDTELPEGADMYDLMIAKMMQVVVLDGNVKAFEAVRDSAGDKPTEKVQQEVAVMTDKDKELMAIIEARMSSRDGQSKK
jgi:hypothetical protein